MAFDVPSPSTRSRTSPGHASSLADTARAHPGRPLGPRDTPARPRSTSCSCSPRSAPSSWPAPTTCWCSSPRTCWRASPRTPWPASRKDAPRHRGRAEVLPDGRVPRRPHARRASPSLYGTGRDARTRPWRRRARAAAVAAGSSACWPGCCSRPARCPATSGCPTSTEGAARAVAAFVTTVPEDRRARRAVPAGRRGVRRRRRRWAAGRAARRGHHDAGQPGRLPPGQRAPPAGLLHDQPGRLPADARRRGRPHRPGPPALLFYLAALRRHQPRRLRRRRSPWARDRSPTTAGWPGARPGLALALVVCLLGLVGTPPDRGLRRQAARLRRRRGRRLCLARRGRRGQHRGQPLLLPALDPARSFAREGDGGSAGGWLAPVIAVASVVFGVAGGIVLLVLQ